jgi:transketolase
MPFVPYPWMRWKPRIRAIPACRWAWRMSATVLFEKHLKFDPAPRRWPDRDRFVLSAGHGSMLIYSLLHLTGLPDMTLDEIKATSASWARTTAWPSRIRPCHEGRRDDDRPAGSGHRQRRGHGHGRGHLNAPAGAKMISLITIPMCIAGDGCLMEGISQEAITLAGHLKLNKLIVLFDDNSVTIDGGTDLSDNTDQCARFEASGWVTKKVDGHDEKSVEAALTWAKKQKKPVMLAVKTIIGYGAPKIAGTGKAHGGPYGAEEIAGIRENIGWKYPPFEVPASIEKAWAKAGERSKKEHEAWKKRLAASDHKGEFNAAMTGRLPKNIAKAIIKHKKAVAEGGEKKATRQWSGAALEVLTHLVPEMVGGSADLTGSNNTKTSHTEPMTPKNWGGRYVHYGVREHGMAAAMNGMALHGGISCLIPARSSSSQTIRAARSASAP